MTDLKNDIRAVKIKNLGPCPEYQGHCCEGCSFVVGLIFGLGMGFLMAVLTDAEWNKWSIKKRLC